MSDIAKFVRAEEVRERTGLTGRTLDRRLAAGLVEVFRDPRDKRRRLIAVEDLDRLLHVVRFDRDGRQAAAERAAG